MQDVLGEPVLTRDDVHEVLQPATRVFNTMPFPERLLAETERRFSDRR